MRWSKCNTISTTEHTLFFCVFPTYFVHKLGMQNSSFYKKTLTVYHVQNNVSNNFFLQIAHLILVAKDRSSKISTGDNILKWDYINF